MEQDFNGLTLEQIHSFLNPHICAELASRSCKQIHKSGFKIGSPLFNFIEFVSDTYFDMEKDFASFRHKKPNQFFKKIWLYCWYCRHWPYDKTRYTNLLKFHNLNDTFLTRVSFDLMWEKLAEESAPIDSMTFLAYKEVIKKEGALFALESFYRQAGIVEGWKPLEEHLIPRYKKDILRHK